MSLSLTFNKVSLNSTVFLTHITDKKIMLGKLTKWNPKDGMHNIPEKAGSIRQEALLFIFSVFINYRGQG